MSIFRRSSPAPLAPESAPRCEMPPETHLHLLQPCGLALPGPPPRDYPGLILDYEPGRHICVSAPMQDGAEASIADGSAITLQIRQGPTLQSFSTRVLSRLQEPSPALLLAWPAGSIRLNRRDSVRIPTRVTVDATYSGLDGTSEMIRGTTSDLSEGGMLLLTPVPLPSNAVLSVRMHLPVDETHVCGGRVVRTGTVPLPGGTAQHWAGIEFRNVSTAAQRDLRHYLFGIQREIIRAQREGTPLP